MSLETLNLQNHVRWPLFLLMGCLSMFYAEILSGSSGYWFIDFWSLAITFWLYLAHVILFLNVAMRIKKTSPIHLYLFGVLFGLYESWITQVLWYGYYNEDPSTVLMVAGIAITNTVLLIFFWHPIFSFLLPVFVFEIFALEANSKVKIEDRIFISHFRFFENTTTNNRKFIVLILIGSLFVASNYGGDFIKVIIVLLGSYGLIYFFKTQAEKKCTPNFSIKSLRLESMTGLLVYLAILYLGMFYISGVLQNRIPSVEGIITVLGLYAVFILVLAKTNPIDEQITTEIDMQARALKEKDYKQYMILNVVFAIIVCILLLVIPAFIGVLGLITYLSMMFGGVLIVIRAVIVRNQINTQKIDIQKKYSPSGIFCAECGREIIMPGLKNCPYCGFKLPEPLV